MDASTERDGQILASRSHVLEDSSADVKTPILRLSPGLRRRIYMDTDINVLVRYPAWDPRDRKYAVLNLNGGNCQPSPWQYRPDIKLGIYGLLVCCRTIYAEVSALLYSSNRFVIRYWEKQSLSPLRALTPSSLSNLTHLKIVLNQSSCHHRDPECFEDSSGLCDDHRRFDNIDPHSEYHDAPLDIREARAKTLLDEWQSAVEYLSRHISPGKLELCVVCDVRPDDLEAATEFLKPISHFPKLQNCHLRLSRHPSPQLHRMAQDMVLKARGLALSDERLHTPRTEPQIGGRLFTLPRELRFRILSYTDLITPWKEVEWSRDCNDDDGKYVALYRSCGILGGLDCADHLHHGCQFLNCWPAHNQRSKAGIGCFCQVRHSAASSTCVCWAPPIALFLVNRALLHDAQVVFFSGNRFVVHDFRVDLPWITPCGSSLQAQHDGQDSAETEGAGVSEYHADQLAASIFLRKKVPHQMLGELRELELVFPPYINSGWPGEGHRALADWIQTLRWARDKLNLPGLTLQLVMTDSLDEEVPPGRPEITSEQVESILSAYRRIASPISILAQARSNEDAAKLRGFYAQVAWPWDHNWGYEDKLFEWGWRRVKDYRRDRHEELREEIERLVLGQRDNEVYVSSRDPPWESIWKDRFEIKME